MLRWLIAAFVLVAVPASAQISTQSGLWSSPSTWGGSPSPRCSDVAAIRAGTVVELDINACVADLLVDGTLILSRTQSSSLTISGMGGLGGLLVRDGGRLDMGTPADPIPTSITHTLTFHLTQAQALAFTGTMGGVMPMFRPSDGGLWVFEGGRLDIHGQTIRRLWGKLDADVAAGATQVVVAGDVGDWPVGGTVVLSQTTPGNDWFIRGPTSTNPRNDWRVRYETELCTIAAVDRSRLTCAAPVKYARRGTGDFRGDVGLLSHNVVIRTVLDGMGDIANDVRERRFAHLVYLPGSSGNIEYVELRDMGTYGKQGDYALHLHRMQDGSRGMIVRGVSCVQSGLRCVNVHESNGVLVEDTVSYEGMGAQFYVEVDSPSLGQADTAFVHNLVVGQLPLAFADRNNDAIFGERLRGNTGFWFCEDHEAALGNVAAGPPRTSEDATGFHCPEAPTSTAGTMPHVVLANEAHSETQAGFHLWQNRAVGFDLVGFTSWGNGTGMVHGAYGFPVYTYRAVFAENWTAYGQNVITGFVQDSVIRGRGAAGVPLLDADSGIAIGNYSIAPSPVTPSRYRRVTFSDLTPSVSGQLGTAIEQSHAPCLTAGADLLPFATACSATWVRLAGNTYGPNLQAVSFGPSPNANTFWVDADRGLLLTRRDQQPATSPFAQVFTAPATYDLATDALVTPLSALQPVFVWSGVDNRNRPITMSTPLVDPLPPVIEQRVTLAGTVASMTATVSADTTKVELWRDWNPICTVTRAPWTCTTDVAVPVPGDLLPPRHYAYLWARGFNDSTINGGYLQRAYSAVTEIGPEVLLADQAPSPPPPVDPAIAELQQQIAQLTNERDSARQSRDALQAQLVQVQALLSTAEAMRLSAEQQVTALQNQLGVSEAARLSAEQRASMLNDLIARIRALLP